MGNVKTKSGKVPASKINLYAPPAVKDYLVPAQDPDANYEFRTGSDDLYLPRSHFANLDSPSVDRG